MPDIHEQTYQLVYDHARGTALLQNALSGLFWDERTMMPAGAAEFRSEQVALLSGMIHRRQTAPELGEWLAGLAESPLAEDRYSDMGCVIHQLKRDYDKKARLPQKLVEEIARTGSLAHNVWVEARRDNNFEHFRPMLEKMIGLKREEAEALGYADTPYDALLDDYEQGETTARVARVLGDLREALVPLVRAIAESPSRPDATILTRPFPVSEQEMLGRKAAAAIGFDFEAGRLDVTAHPFCCTMGPRDVRLTTRYDERSFGDAFFSTLHEAGHGIYEQGLRGEHFGLPLGEAVSLGVHESQSRMWENQVARSRAFWEFFYPQTREAFPEALGVVSMEEFYGAVNDVRPSLIRVEADEVTYNLHILIRFELETQLLAGELEAADLPGAWNQKYQDYLGVVSPTDSDGVLQDVHWSEGLIGYFPTYALGNLYAAQFFQQACEDIPGLVAGFAKGRFEDLRAWLRERIHTQGRKYTPAELVERVTGRPLSHDSLLAHLTEKFGEIYRL